MSALELHLSNCKEARQRKDELEIVKQLPCPECSNEYMALDYLLIHIQSHYVGDVECSPCRKSFPSVGDLSKHLSSCSSKEFYKCSDCSKQYINALSLRTHLPTCKSLTQCLKCAKVIIERGCCKDHMTMHLTTEWAKKGLKMSDGVLRRVLDNNELSEDSNGKEATLPVPEVPSLKSSKTCERSISPHSTKSSPKKSRSVKSPSCSRKKNPSKDSSLENSPESFNKKFSSTKKKYDTIADSSPTNSSSSVSKSSDRLSKSPTIPESTAGKSLQDNQNVTEDASIPSSVSDDDFEAPLCDDLPLADEDNFSVIDDEVYEIENNLGEPEFVDDAEFFCSETLPEHFDDAEPSQDFVPEVESNSQEANQLFTPALIGADNGESGSELTLTVVNVEGGTNLFTWDECEDNVSNEDFIAVENVDVPNTFNEEAFNSIDCVTEECIDSSNVEVETRNVSDKSIQKDLESNGNVGAESGADVNEDRDSGIDATEDRDSNKDIAEDPDVCNEVTVNSSSNEDAITTALPLQTEVLTKSKFSPLTEHTYALKEGQLPRPSKFRSRPGKPHPINLSSEINGQASQDKTTVTSSTVKKKRPKKSKEVVLKEAQEACQINKTSTESNPVHTLERPLSSGLCSSRFSWTDQGLEQEHGVDGFINREILDRKDPSQFAKVDMSVVLNTTPAGSLNPQSWNNEALSQTLSDTCDNLNVALLNSDSNKICNDAAKSTLGTTRFIPPISVQKALGVASPVQTQRSNETLAHVQSDLSESITGPLPSHNVHQKSNDGISLSLRTSSVIQTAITLEDFGGKIGTLPAPTQQKSGTTGTAKYINLSQFLSSGAKLVTHHGEGNSKKLLLPKEMLPMLKKTGSCAFLTTQPNLKALQILPNNQKLQIVDVVQNSNIQTGHSGKTVSNTPNANKSDFSSLNIVDVTNPTAGGHSSSLYLLARGNKLIPFSENKSDSAKQQREAEVKANGVNNSAQSRVVNFNTYGPSLPPLDPFRVENQCSNVKPSLKSTLNLHLLKPCSQDTDIRKPADEVLNNGNLLKSSDQCINVQMSTEKETVSEISNDLSLRMQRREKSMLSRGFKPMATITPLQGRSFRTSMTETTSKNGISIQNPLHIVAKSSNSLQKDRPGGSTNVILSNRERSMLSHGFQQMATILPHKGGFSNTSVEELVSEKTGSSKEPSMDTSLSVSSAKSEKSSAPLQQMTSVLPKKRGLYSQNILSEGEGSLIESSNDRGTAENKKSLYTNEFEMVSSPPRKEDLLKGCTKSLLMEAVSLVKTSGNPISMEKGSALPHRIQQAASELPRAENFFNTVMNKITTDRVNVNSSKESSSYLKDDSRSSEKEEAVPTVMGKGGKLFSAFITRMISNGLKTAIKHSPSSVEIPSQKDVNSIPNDSHLKVSVLPPKKKYLKESCNFKDLDTCKESPHVNEENNYFGKSTTSCNNAFMFIVSSDGDVLPHPKFSSAGTDATICMTENLPSNFKYLPSSDNEAHRVGAKQSTVVEFSKDENKTDTIEDSERKGCSLGKQIDATGLQDMQQNQEASCISPCKPNLPLNTAVLDTILEGTESKIVQDPSKKDESENLSKRKEVKRSNKKDSKADIFRVLQSTVPNLSQYKVVLMSSDDDSEEEEVPVESSTVKYSSVSHSSAEQATDATSNIEKMKGMGPIITQNDFSEGTNTIPDKNSQLVQIIRKSPSSNVLNFTPASVITKNAHLPNLCQFTSEGDAKFQHDTGDMNLCPIPILSKDDEDKCIFNLDATTERHCAMIDKDTNKDLSDKGELKIEKSSSNCDLNTPSTTRETDDVIDTEKNNIDDTKLKETESIISDVKKCVMNLGPINLVESNTSSSLYGASSSAEEFFPVNGPAMDYESTGDDTFMDIGDSDVPVDQYATIRDRERIKIRVRFPVCKHPSRMLMPQMTSFKRSKFGREGLYKNNNSSIFKCSNCISWFHSLEDLRLHKCLRAMISKKFTSEYLDRFYDVRSESGNGFPRENNFDFDHICSKEEKDKHISNLDETIERDCAMIDKDANKVLSCRYSSSILKARKAYLKGSKFGREGLFKKRNSGILRCSFCTLWFHSEADLEFHQCLKAMIMEKFTSDCTDRFFGHDKKNEAGPESQSVDIQMSPYENYIRVKTIVKSRQFPCDKCQIKFRSFSALLDHKSTMHSERSSLQCHVCSKQFDRLQKLAVHYAKSHKASDQISGKEKHLKVEKCVPQWSQLASTGVSDSVKTGAVEVLQSVCNKGLSSMEDSKDSEGLQILGNQLNPNMSESLKIGSEDSLRETSSKMPTPDEILVKEEESLGEGPGHCNLDTTDLGRENLNHCPTCNKGFKTKAGLKSHINQTHSVIRCPVCAKKFTYQQSMESHHKANHAMDIASESSQESKILVESVASNLKHTITTSSVVESLVPEVDLKDSSCSTKSSQVNINPLCTESLITNLTDNEPCVSTVGSNDDQSTTGCPCLKKKHKKSKWRIVNDPSSEKNTSAEPGLNVDLSRSTSSDEEKVNLGPETVRPLILSLSKVKRHRYSCHDCAESFRKQHLLLLHRAKEHETSGKFLCSMCDLELGDFSQLESHVKLCKRNNQCDNKFNGTYGPAMIPTEDKPHSCVTQDLSSFSTQLKNVEDRNPSEVMRVLGDDTSPEAQICAKNSELDSRHSTEKDFSEISSSISGLQSTVSPSKVHKNQERRKTRYQLFSETLRMGMGSTPFLSQNLSQKSWKCGECHKDFKSRGFLHRHKIEYHEVPCQYKCTLCGLKFTELLALQRHHKIKHKREKFDESEEVTLSDSSLSATVVQNEKEMGDSLRKKSYSVFLTGQKKLIKCRDCSNVFSKYESLKQHRKRLHRKRVFHPCHLCGLKFNSIKLLSSHKLHRHPSVVHSKNVNDSVLVQTLSSMKQPFSSSDHPTGSKFIRTESAASNFASNDVSLEPIVNLEFSMDLKENLCSNLQEEGNKVFGSDISDDPKLTKEPRSNILQKRRFDEIQLEKQNNPLENTEAFKCSDCPMTYRVYSCLKRHRIQAHDEKANFNCHICGKGFSYRHSLKNHIMIHSRGKSNNKRLKKIVVSEISTEKLKTASEKMDSCREEVNNTDMSEISTEKLMTASERIASGREEVINTDMLENVLLSSSLGSNAANKSPHLNCDIKIAAKDNENMLAQNIDTLAAGSSSIPTVCSEEKSAIQVSAFMPSETCDNMPSFSERDPQGSYVENMNNVNFPLISMGFSSQESGIQKVTDPLPIVDSYDSVYNPTIAQPVTLENQPTCDNVIGNDVSFTDLTSVSSSVPSLPMNGYEWMTPFHKPVDFNQCSGCGSRFPSWYALQGHQCNSYALPSYAAYDHATLPFTVPQGYPSYYSYESTYSSFQTPVPMDPSYTFTNAVLATNTVSFQELVSHHSATYCSLCGLCFPSLIALQEHYVMHMSM